LVVEADKLEKSKETKARPANKVAVKKKTKYTI